MRGKTWITDKIKGLSFRLVERNLGSPDSKLPERAPVELPVHTVMIATG